MATIPEFKRAVQHTTALIGGLTMDAITPHGKISAADIADTLQSHLTLLVGWRALS